MTFYHRKRCNDLVQGHHRQRKTLTDGEREEREERRALNDNPGIHAPPPLAARRGSTAAHLPPLRCAHGSETAPPCAESATHGHARRSGCVLLRGSGQPAPPTCRSRLRAAGCAVCPSRRSHTPATLAVPRCAAHTQPTLWAWPAGSLTCAGRVGSSRRRALRYGRWAAALSSSFAGGGGVWASLAAQWGCP